MANNYPKVLIVGPHFDLTSGGGITMTNLFKGWDKKNIAVAGERIRNFDTTVCNTYYQLGYAENKRRFPFFLWQKKEKSGSIPITTNTPSPQLQLAVKLVSKKMAFYNKLLHFAGLYHYTRRLKSSIQFANWLEQYAPDIIYSQLSSLELIKFISNLNKKYKLPVIIHIMDDWPSTISKASLFQSFWNKIIDKQFRLLLNNSKKLMSISEAMSDEYLLRYKKYFIPFHNPINVATWQQHSKINYSKSEIFIILYAGRIGTGIQECFFDIVKAIDELVKTGLKIEFHLQSTSSSYVIDAIGKYDFVKIKKPVPYNQLPALFASVDVLLLPNDFDAVSVSFLKFSMPTKASEYMATGTPILLYASAETAIAKHAKKNKWAYIVTKNKKEDLVNAIVELYQNDYLRKEIGNVAKAFSTIHYSDIEVNKQFRQSFL